MRFPALILSLVLLLGPQITGCASRHTTAITVGGARQYSELEVSFGFFHNSLSPYGHWVNIGSYGPCWRPANLVVGWQPYFHNGYWAYTEYGWTWISRDPWGHIAFHYGTWFYDPFYGWVWMPGYVWGPAWVTWMYTDHYIGWAPLPPTFRFRGRHGFAGRPVVVNNNYYVFVSSEHINTTNLNIVSVPVEKRVEIIRTARPATTISIVNNHIINHGLDAPATDRIKRTPMPIEQVSREARIKPIPVKLSREDVEIELAEPKVNRQEAKRVIKDFNCEERAARADRERQLNQERKKSADQLGVKPSPKKSEVNNDREQRRIEREQRRQQEEQLRRQELEQREAEKLRKQQEKQQRQLEQKQHHKQGEQLRQQEHQHRQQQQEVDKLRKQQEKQQRRIERNNRRQVIEQKNLQ
ncbi:MAG: DUF6600 domain-containing protein [Acidobacteriota bacterium]